ncbi:unnamed protein product [Prunus brigantina]
MATSHPNAEIIAINNIPFSTSSSSYGDPCLDLLFNSIVLYERDPNPCLIYLKQLLPLAWSQNPLTTLKLIFSVESICFSYQNSTPPCFGSSRTTPRLCYATSTLLPTCPTVGVCTPLSKFCTSF